MKVTKTDRMIRNQATRLWAGGQSRGSVHTGADLSCGRRAPYLPMERNELAVPPRRHKTWRQLRPARAVMIAQAKKRTVQQDEPAAVRGQREANNAVSVELTPCTHHAAIKMASHSLIKRRQ